MIFLCVFINLTHWMLWKLRCVSGVCVTHGYLGVGGAEDTSCWLLWDGCVNSAALRLIAKAPSTTASSYTLFKGIVHLEIISFFPVFTHLCVVLNSYDFLSSVEHKWLCWLLNYNEWTLSFLDTKEVKYKAVWSSTNHFFIWSFWSFSQHWF